MEVEARGRAGGKGKLRGKGDRTDERREEEGKINTHEQMRRQVHSRPLTQLMRETFSDRLDRGLGGVIRWSAATVLFFCVRV